MDATIQASFGLDVAGFDAGLAKVETGAKALEKRLEAVGVSFAEAPRKLAAESAKAFEEVAAAEAKLAAFREKTAFERLSKEEQINVLIQQSIELEDQADAIKGQSVEKTNLQLASEKKRNEAFQIYRQQQDAALASQKASTRETEEQARKATGLSGTFTEIKKNLKDIGVSIKGAGIGILFAQVMGFAKEAINDAQKLRDEFEKGGAPISANTASLARFGDGIDNVKKAATSFVGFVVSGWSLIGEAIGSGINAIRGYDEAQQRVMENIAKQTEKTMEEQEKRRKKFNEENSPEKLAAAAKELAELDRKYHVEKLEGAAKILALQKDVKDILDKINTTNAKTVEYYKLQGDLVKKINDLSGEREKIEENVNKKLKEFFGDLDEQSQRNMKSYEALEESSQRLADLEFEKLDPMKQQEVLTASIDELKRQLLDKEMTIEDRIAKQNQLADLQIQLGETLDKITRKRADSEEKITKQKQIQAELDKKNQKIQADFLGSLYMGGLSRDEAKDATPEALQEIIRRNKASMVGLSEGSAFSYGDSLKLVQLRNEIATAQNELNERASFKQKVDAFGVEGARRMFTGNPLDFESLVDRILNNKKQEEQTKILGNIDRTLTDAFR